MKKIQIVAVSITVACIASTDAAIRDYKEEKRSEERQKLAAAINTGYVNSDARFYVCENRNGIGFYWVDTTSGAVWWAHPDTKIWEYYGSPNTPTGEKGRFIPFQCDGSGGLYVLDTEWGLGWWTDGAEWKEMGKPNTTPNQRVDPTVKKTPVESGKVQDTAGHP